MHTAESKNEHLESNNFQPSADAQILSDPSSNAEEEIKKSDAVKTEESIQQTYLARNFKRFSEKRSQQLFSHQFTSSGNSDLHQEERNFFKWLKKRENKKHFRRKKNQGVILLMIWILLLSLSGKSSLPGGKIFGLLIIFYSALLGGKLLELIKLPSVPPLPPLLGMLLAGFLVRNIPFINKHINIPTTWSSALRSSALTVILVRAGFGMDPEALKNLKGVCLRLSFGPCIIEACSAAVFSHYIMKFPWQWGFLLGFVLGAVSPAVVVPSMLLLQERGFGINKGIPTLLIAASSLDDVVAITGFNTFLSIVFSSGSILRNILSSLRDIFIGVVIGAIMGFFVQHFPSRDQERCTLKRAFLVLSICVSVVLGSQLIGLHGSGGLCTLVLSFMAATKWAKEKVGIQKVISHTWNIFQPLLFGLVGSEVSVESLESNSIGSCLTTLGLALLVRILATFTLMSFAGFSFKEKIFIALAWIPKATVQAVLGPLALETARFIGTPHLEFYSRDVMTVAFLAILITAPNGALLIGILGTKTLKFSDLTSEIKVHMKSFEYH